ncbi:MAG: hypothetical protein HOP31_11050 [Ignavibacteria bacterium]|nr:hypothetical protein [Ignavibacteria bacterium]
MKTKILLTVLLLIACAYSANSQERIKFKKGEYFTNIEGGVPRGEVYSYVVGASKGQFMTITIMSPEDNAVFYILRTDNWQYMAGATEDNPTTRWEGTLPANGDYQIVVGSNRGGAEYTLQVVIE